MADERESGNEVNLQNKSVHVFISDGSSAYPNMKSESRATQKLPTTEIVSYAVTRYMWRSHRKHNHGLRSDLKERERKEKEKKLSVRPHASASEHLTTD